MLDFLICSIVRSDRTNSAKHSSWQRTADAELSSPITVGLTLVIFLLLLVLILCYNRFRGHLHSIPGPFINSISSLPRLWSVWKGTSHLEDVELHKKYGKIVRVSPTIVSVCDLTFFESIYGISSHFYKAGFYEACRFYDEEGLIPDPLVLADKDMHTRMKRNAANAYSLQALIQIEPLVDQVLKSLLDRFDEIYVSQRKTCDLGQYMLYFAMDAIFTITFGKNLDFVRKGDTKKLCHQVRSGLPYIACVGQIPWAHKFLLGNPLVAKFLDGPSDSLAGEIMAMAVDQRAAAEKKINEDDDPSAPCTFLMRLLRNQSKSPASLTDREINSHTFGNILAGGDTTSTAVKAILYYLIRNPESMNRLVAKLREAGLDSKGSIVSYSDASKIPYLSAVIREAMRLHPSVGMILPRGVPPGGAILLDEQGKRYHMGGGTEIGFNPWVMQRDPDIFSDPDSFKPERWIDTDASRLKSMNRAWIAFGAGRHSCSGQHISMLEMTKLIPSLVLKYEMEWEDGAPDIAVENYFFTMQSGLRVRLSRRQ
ncbi:cytochrome P450 [Truncatella angustata]|uniref:Cytochrome P450 n=1 Tax=Truncatella angustata TaxID=152316 RepID=A0A9P8UBP3_9PEZI|nr:cytochrome P450 [Truncatella angustata]KAH6643351.1 cytochrome P450 [Truncatella angustata]